MSRLQPTLFFQNNRWAGDVLAAIAGSLITLSLAPFDIWPLGILSLIFLHYLLENISPARAAWRGWCFGAGLFLSGASWLYVSIHDFGGASLVLAAFLSGAFCLLLALLHAMFGYGYVRWIRDKKFGRWLGFAAWWTIWEWVIYWLCTGFPWLYVGYAHLTTPLSGWAPIGGIYTLSFIIALTAAGLIRLIKHETSLAQKWIPTALAAVLWLGGFVLQSMTWTQPKGEPIRVALVQANIPQSVKWDPNFFRETLDIYSHLSAPLWRDNDIVFWPEAAVPALYENAKPFFDVNAAAAARYNHALISGVPYRSEHGEFFNSAIAIGNGSGIYHKQHLVPFGEYVPFEKYLRGLIEFFDLPMSDFQAGPSGQAPLQAAGLTFAPFICYEVVFGDLVRHARADVLLTLTNDAWFGHSIGPLQHLRMVQMRALEMGRPFVRATSNGVTVLIDSKGHITARIPQFERAVLTGTVQGYEGVTPFARFGSWPILLMCGVIVLFCLTRRYQ
ncbi:MAG: apolipoprotein N-acyltransferase [Spongiibacteraceae bacterium]